MAGRGLPGRRARPALVLRWQDPHAPLPVRVIRPLRPAHRPAAGAAPDPAAARWDTGPAGEPFDFCASVRRLLTDVAARCPELAHIRMPRILLAVTQARSGQVHGLQARVTPLRFPHGSLTRPRRGVTYQVQRYFHGEQEFLYLMTFCLPRFLDQDFDDKFVTLFHELFHISPAFDGDLRRHEGRYHLHTHDQHGYDKHMAHLARAYLAGRPDDRLYAFLRLSFGQLQRRHGSVTGIVVPRPKIVPLVGALASSPAAAVPSGALA